MARVLETLNCPSCGAPYSEQSQNCSYCGATFLIDQSEMSSDSSTVILNEKTTDNDTREQNTIISNSNEGESPEDSEYEDRQGLFGVLVGFIIAGTIGALALTGYFSSKNTSVPSPSYNEIPIQRSSGVNPSDENDKFARNVVAILKNSMPPFRNIKASLSIKVILNNDGTLSKVEVTTPSNIAGLDQSVLSAISQTTFPNPPQNATLKDLIFNINYVYK